MASGKQIFYGPVPFIYKLEGCIDDQKFTVEGKGIGDATKGTLKGKYWCTTGNLPMSWKALAPLLGYGFQCYVKYPLGMEHFYQETMPGGYNDDRIFKFEDDGRIKSHREVRFENGKIVSIGSMVLENFPKDSPIYTQSLESPFPTRALNIAHKDGLKTLMNLVYPKTSGGYYTSDSTIISRPRGGSKSMSALEPHYTHIEFKQLKDANLVTGEDHVIEEDHFEAFYCKLRDSDSFHLERF